MNNDYNRGILKNNYRNFAWLKIIFLLISFLLGSVLILYSFKYINSITIFNTFLILLSVYVLQLILEIFKISLFTLNENINGRFKLILNKKILFLNLLFFLISCFCILSCLIFGLLFTKIQVIFNILMGLGLGIIYLFYTIELFKIIDYTFLNIKFKNYIYDLIFIWLINSLCITMLISIMYLIKYLGGFTVVIITLVNMILFNINNIRLKNLHFMGEL